MQINFKQSYFVIEGPGKAMDAITAWLDELAAVRTRNKALADEIGVTQYSFDRDTGVISGVIFDCQPPADWKKPNKHKISYPKLNSEWRKRLAKQIGHPKASDQIRSALGIPTSFQAIRGGGDYRRFDMGNWFNPCQFGTLNGGAIRLLVIPDVAYYILEAETEGWTVPDEIKSFKPEFDGCRQITKRELEIMELKSKAASAAKGA